MNKLFFLLILTLIFSDLRSEKYGEYEKFPSITFKGNIYYCVFAPFTRLKLPDDEKWRWDSCIVNNKEILIPHTTYFYQENYVINNNKLILESVFAYGMTSNHICVDFDCDITDCLNPLTKIEYSGYAICSKDGKKESEYFVFVFLNDILVSFSVLSWTDFEKFLDKDKKEGGCVYSSMLKSGWLNWDTLHNKHTNK